MEQKTDNFNNIFRFTVELASDISRTIDIFGTDDLYQFANIIGKAFGFDINYQFGFYNIFTNYIVSDILPIRADFNSECYELFNDLGFTEDKGIVGFSFSKKAKGVKGHLIKNIFVPNKKMLFVFCGEWVFLITCVHTIPSEKKKFTASIVNELTRGNSPTELGFY